MLARRQIERAKVAVLVIDAAEGVTSGDLAIAGTIWELGRAAVVAGQQVGPPGPRGAAGEAREVLAAARRAAGRPGPGQCLGPLGPRGREALPGSRPHPRGPPAPARHRRGQSALRGRGRRAPSPRQRRASPGRCTTPPRWRPARRPSCSSPTGRWNAGHLPALPREPAPRGSGPRRGAGAPGRPQARFLPKIACPCRFDSLYFTHFFSLRAEPRADRQQGLEKARDLGLQVVQR